MPKAQIPLGLDLQGGVHLVLEMNIEELKKAWYDQLMDDTRKILREAKIPSPSTDANRQADHRQGPLRGRRRHGRA